MLLCFDSVLESCPASSTFTSAVSSFVVSSFVDMSSWTSITSDEAEGGSNEKKSSGLMELSCTEYGIVKMLKSNSSLAFTSVK